MRAKNITEVIKEQQLNEWGAGYAVYGGSPGGFGNPSMGGRTYGRGFGFGQSSSSNGGPNLMYTYSIKPLSPILQQPATPQGNERYIHMGSTIKGYIMGTKNKSMGYIVNIKENSDRDVLYYEVIDADGRRVKIDPTSAKLINREQTPETSMRDILGENFYPSLQDYLSESHEEDLMEKCKRSKLPTEIKELVCKLGLSKFEDGRAYRINKPRIKGKSFDGVDLGADRNGFFVYTHRARSKSYETPERIPNKDIKFIKSTG